LQVKNPIRTHLDNITLLTGFRSYIINDIPARRSKSNKNDKLGKIGNLRKIPFKNQENYEQNGVPAKRGLQAVFGIQETA